MKKSLCVLSLIVLLAGFVLGPGYYLYSRFLSGKAAGEYLLYERNIQSVSVGSHSLSTSDKGEWKTPITLELAPEMNPIGFNIKAVIGNKTHRHKGMTSEYTATLQNGSEAVWTTNFSIVQRNNSTHEKQSSAKLDGRDVQTVPLETFSVEQPGSYRFDAKQVQDELGISELTLKVRRNILVPKMGIVISGILMLVVGIVGAVVLQRKPKKTER